jgi:hypothetical protein
MKGEERAGTRRHSPVSNKLPRQYRDAAIATDHIPGRARTDIVDKGVTLRTEGGNLFQTGIHQVNRGGINYSGVTPKRRRQLEPV